MTAKHDLRLATITSIVVAVVMAAASGAGLVDWQRTYPGIEAKMVPLFVGQDALNLIVGLPALVGSMWIARRGSLIGLLLWPGALFYVAYDYGYYVLGGPYTWLFLPYVALVTLSMFASIAVIVRIDRDAVRDQLSRRIPARAIGGFLAGLAILFMTLWTALNLSAAGSGLPIDPVLRVVTIMDLGLQLPALLLGGILLWRRSSLGYVAAAGLLLQAGAYLAGLSAITLLQESLMATPFDSVAVIPGFVVGAIGLTLVAVFVRGSHGHSEIRHPAPTFA